MSTTSRLMLRATAAAGTVAVLMASGASVLLFASPAAADVTGYQTGYTYHQGLATGAGGALEAQAGNGATAVAPTTSVAPATTNTSAAPVQTAPAQQTTAPASQPQAQAVTPAAQTQTAPAANVNTAAAPAAASTAFANVITPIAWAVIVVALLGLIAAGIWAANREPTTRVRRTEYRRTA